MKTAPKKSLMPVRVEEGPKRFTGKLMVRLDPSASTAAIVKQAAYQGLRLSAEADKDADGVIFERLKVAVVNEAGAAKLEQLHAMRDTVFLSIEPERYIRALAKGRSKAVPLKDTAAAAWGIQAIHAAGSVYTGKGVKVAVLDTGFDFGHPDFAGRTIHRKSFTGGRQATDKEGHGTHCAGIAAGGRKGKIGMRYGVASGVRLHIGKILNDDGEGTDSQALAGIEWALEKGCQVISMSFGAPVLEGQAHSEVFEQAAQIAMASKCLLIGATGNESDREEEVVSPVNHPANCPSVMAVGALTTLLGVAAYSSGGVAGFDGQVDIAAPGDNILSAKPGGRYRRESGTSMATAFVAGVAALLWEEFPQAGAAEIWVKLAQRARRPKLAASDVGVGLVSAG